MHPFATLSTPPSLFHLSKCGAASAGYKMYCFSTETQQNGSKDLLCFITIYCVVVVVVIQNAVSLLMLFKMPLIIGLNNNVGRRTTH